jgi:hypothetical protein
MKNRFLFIATIVAFSLNVYSQNSSLCGTTVPDEYRQYYNSKDRTGEEFRSPARSGRAMKWIPVSYHIITKTDGTEGIKIRDVFDSHCELNQTFNPFDIGFYISSIDTIRDTNLWSYQSQFLGYQAFGQYNKPNTCNVYINGNLPGLCGFATLPGTGSNGGGMFLNRSCVGANTKTYPHEMGHYLGLLHTFEDGNGIEFVNGTNCSTAGDKFCDTPADFSDSRTACPYTGTRTDPNGDLYRDVIDETLIMSYFSDNCVNRFSTQQKAEMNNVLQNRRTNLINQTVPNLDNVDTTTFVTPLLGDTNVVSNHAVITWRAIPGANYYLFYLQSATSSVIYTDTILADTTIIVTNILPNKTYKYRVKGITLYNPCSDNTSFATFKTSFIKSTVAATNATCFGANDGTVTLTPTNGTAPYGVLWSNGSTGVSLTGLAAGTYTATITDANGETAVAPVIINSASAIEPVIGAVGTNLNATVTGGTPPYNYTWSNGVTTASNNNVPYGNYTVSVVDARGCAASAQFVFSGIANDDNNVSCIVFPNPASSGQKLNIQVSLTNAANIEFSLFDVNGKTIQSSLVQAPSGSSIHIVSTDAIATGVYVLQIKGDSFLRTQRVTIVR